MDGRNELEREPGAIAIDIEPQTFLLWPPLRRCVWYWAVGMGAVAGVVAALGLLLPPASPDYSASPDGSPAAFCVFLLLAALPLSAACSWRLRVDSSGIHRTFLLFLRRTWTWELFRSGKMLYRKRPNDKEHIGFSDALILSEQDAERVLAVIDAVWTPPELPVPPARLDLKHRPGRKRLPLAFHEGGIDAVQGGTARSYSWADVESVVLARGNRREQGFYTCTVALPHGALILERKSDGAGNWQGADDRVIEAFVRAHCPEERLSVGVLGGTPRSRSDYDIRIKALDTFVRSQRRGLPMMAALMVGLLAALAYSGRGKWNAEFFGILCVVCFLCVTPVAVFAVMLRRRRRELVRLKAERDALTAEDAPSS
ncbi:MAG: hypothetical protein JXR94_06215 [Candidatus Hydrogenedentes bacterium]|nr:hypothetical protein [Candidatus Hydrogenedentota bacterium]